MSLAFVAFGVLSGVTAALLVSAAGANLLVAACVYAGAGAVALISSALPGMPELWV